VVAPQPELCRGNKRSDARKALRDGIELAHACDATVLVDRANDELELARPAGTATRSCAPASTLSRRASAASPSSQRTG
jgi:hypothetical protein